MEEENILSNPYLAEEQEKLKKDYKNLLESYYSEEAEIIIAKCKKFFEEHGMERSDSLPDKVRLVVKEYNELLINEACKESD